MDIESNQCHHEFPLSLSWKLLHSDLTKGRNDSNTQLLFNHLWPILNTILWKNFNLPSLGVTIKNDLQFYISDLYVISVEVHFEPKLIFCFSPQSIKTEDWKIVGRGERRQFCTMTTILLHSLVCTASIPKICTRYLVYRMEDEQKVMAWRWVSTFTIVQL